MCLKLEESTFEKDLFWSTQEIVYQWFQQQQQQP